MPYYVAEFYDENGRRYKKNMWAVNHVKASASFYKEYPYAKLISIKITYDDTTGV